MAGRKKCSIADSDHVMLTITNSNKKQLKHFEEKLKKEMAVDSVNDVPNSTIVNYAISAAYRRGK